MLRFRESPVSDPAAHALLTEYFASRAEGFPASQGVYQTSFPDPENFVPPAGVFLVAEEQHDPSLAAGSSPAARAVGCGGIRRLSLDATFGVTYEVKHLWLQPATRGKGYGRILLRELEDRARGFGAHSLVLDTNASLAAAGGLYRSSGFEDTPPYNSNPNATNWYRKSLV